MEGVELALIHIGEVLPSGGLSLVTLLESLDAAKQNPYPRHETGVRAYKRQ